MLPRLGQDGREQSGQQKAAAEMQMDFVGFAVFKSRAARRSHVEKGYRLLSPPGARISPCLKCMARAGSFGHIVGSWRLASLDCRD